MVEDVDAMGWNLLHWCAASGFDGLISLLDQECAARLACAQDSRGATPFHIAAAGGGLPLQEYTAAGGVRLDALLRIAGKDRKQVAATDEVPAADISLGFGNADMSLNDSLTWLVEGPFSRTAAALGALVSSAIDTPDAAGETPLHWAMRCMTWDVAGVLAQLRCDPGLTRRADKATPLHLAAALGAPTQLVEACLSLYPEAAHVQDGEGRTPLVVACSHPGPESAGHVSALLENGCDPNGVPDIVTVDCPLEASRVPLFAAVSAGNISAVEILGCHPLLKGDVVDPSSGETPLTAAIVRNDPLLCRALVDTPRGAVSPNFPRQNGDTPLLVAVSCGYLDPAIELLARCDPNHTDASGRTALGVAVARESVPLVKVLMSCGARVGAALHDAARTGNETIMGLLLERGADVNAQPDAAGGATPLIVALEAGKTPLARSLVVNRGADVHRRTLSGTTALHVSAAAGFVDMVELLVRFGADVNAVDRSGRTPLHAAAERGLHETCFALVEAKVMLDAQDSEGRTALHCAAGQCNLPLAAMICMYNATQVPDRRGNTPLHLAAPHKQSKALVRLLVSHGAKLDARNHEGKTAADIAQDSGNPEIAEYLDQGAKGSDLPICKAK